MGSEPSQTFGQLLLTGIFGLLAGLGGVTLQWFLQGRNKAAELEHEKKLTLRAKAEEVFGEADVAEDRMNAALMQAIEDCHGLDRDWKGPSLSLTPTGRLKALLLMYFPDSKVFVDAYTVETAEIFREQMAAIQAAEQQEINERLRLLREARRSAAEKCMAATIELAGNARGLMRNEAQKLL